MKLMRQSAIIIFLATLLIFQARGESVAGLDGAIGNIFKVDPSKQTFELLKETEYDPKTDLGQSRFTVFWTDKSTVTMVEEREDFSGIKGPVIAEFQGIDAAVHGASS